MAWSDNDKLSMKQAAKLAKRRLMESTASGGKKNGETRKVNKEDAKFYKKVLGILTSAETVENPIGVLAGDAFKICSDDNERMKIVLATAKKFNEAKDFIEKNSVTVENFDEKVAGKNDSKNIYARCKLLNNALYNSQYGLSFREKTFKGNTETFMPPIDETEELARLAAESTECTGSISGKCLTCKEECSTKDFILEQRDKGRRVADIISMFNESDSIRRAVMPRNEAVDDKCLAEYEKRKISEIIKEYDMNAENNAHAEKLICERAGDILYTAEGEKTLAADRQALERCDDQSDEVLKLMVKLIQKNYDKLNKQTL